MMMNNNDDDDAIIIHDDDDDDDDDDSCMVVQLECQRTARWHGPYPTSCAGSRDPTSSASSHC